MLIRTIVPAARKIASLNRGSVPLYVRAFASKCEEPYVHPTMDDVPVPCGDWAEDYQNKQRKYNLHLLLGVGFFLITCGVAYSSGLFWMNFLPPEKPGPRPEKKC